MADKGALTTGQSVTKLAYSVEEFAQAVGLSRNHAYGLVRRGQLRAVKAGSCWIIPLKAVERWLESEQRDTNPNGA